MGLDKNCTLEEIPFYFSAADSNWGNSLNRHANFGSLPISFLTLFRCSTGESFNLIMHDLFSSEWGDNMLRCCPTCGPVIDAAGPVSSCGVDPLGSVIPVLFFIFFYILMGYIILNGLFIGVIVENFRNIGTDNKDVTFQVSEGPALHGRNHPCVARMRNCSRAYPSPSLLLARPLQMIKGRLLNPLARCIRFRCLQPCRS
jgi:hypothetical protein